MKLRITAKFVILHFSSIVSVCFIVNIFSERAWYSHKEFNVLTRIGEIIKYACEIVPVCDLEI